MKKVFIGFDKAEVAAFQTCAYSIIKNSSVPVAIIPLNIRHLPWFKNTDYKASTEFAFTRFLVPYLCDYEGQALFMDCDMLVRDDIAKVFEEADPAHSVCVVKHDYKPKMEDKFLGQQQTDYKYKNWSSVMLFNNEKCASLSEHYVSNANGLALHQFKWADSVGSLSPRWNYLVGEDSIFGKIDDPAIVHFTRGGPYFKQFENCEYADEWFQYHREANSVLDSRQVEVKDVR